jgi:hypothetical protein
VEKNKIVLRLENIGDKMDTFYAEDTIYVDLNEFASYLWQAVNFDAEFFSVNFVETTLSGNQEFSKAKASKT